MAPKMPPKKSKALPKGFEDSPFDVDPKGVKEGSKADKALDSKQAKKFVKSKGKKPAGPPKAINPFGKY